MTKQKTLNAAKKYSKPPELIVQPTTQWFKYETEPEQCQYIIRDTEECIQKAEQYIEEDCKLYIQSKGHDRRSFEWLLTVRNNGTRSDQVSSLLVTFEDSHVHNLDSLRTLIQRLNSPNIKYRDIFEIIEPLYQMLVQHVLPDRKLIQLNVRPISKHFLKKCEKCKESKRKLMLWYFEDQLKKLYGQFIDFLEKKLMRCPLEKLKLQLLKTVQSLLCHKPENEFRLLNILVDKIGDSDASISGESIRLILKLVELHPPMKTVIVQTLERLIFRKNIQPKVQHYALTAISQIELEPSDQKLCQHLICCYLSLFKTFAATGQDVSSRLMSNLLIGMRVAFKHCGETVVIEPDQLHSIFTIIHNSQISTAIQAMMLLLNMVKNRPEIADRFYSALYQRMRSEDLLTTRLGEMFLKLLFNAIRNDSSIIRQKAFIKRLLQICLNATPGFIASSLVLCSESLRSNPNLNVLSYDLDKAEALEDDEYNYGNKGGSWVHVDLNQLESKCQYDPLKRNPLYSNANYSICHELIELRNHYHPTVALFAKSLLEGNFINYGTNPFEDLKLINFLDRFAYKTPKAKYKASASLSRSLASNSQEFANLKEEDVNADEMFLHRYMKHVVSNRKNGKVNNETEIDSLFDNYISKKFGIGVESGKNLSSDFASHYSQPGKKSSKRNLEEESEDDGSFEDDSSDDNEDWYAYRKAGDPSDEKDIVYDKCDDDDFPELLEDKFDMANSDAMNVSNEKEFKQAQWESNQNKSHSHTEPRRKNQKFTKRNKTFRKKKSRFVK